MGIWSDMSGGEKVGTVIGASGLLLAGSWLGDKADYFEKDDRALNANEINITGTVPGAIVNAGGVEVDFSTIPGLTCTGPEASIPVDARAMIGSNVSLLKAIEISRPGSQATQLSPNTVYALARAVAAKSGRSDLVSPTQLDNFPLMPAAVIPTNCDGVSVDGNPIKAIN